MNPSKPWLTSIYHQLVEINDTPERKALGFGLGVFLGVFPGMGPIASLVGAYILRVNRAAALVGSLLVNTWFTFLTLAWAAHIGAGISRLTPEQLNQRWIDLSSDFRWAKFQDPEIISTLLAIMAGFLVISFCVGLTAAGTAYFVLVRWQNLKEK